jgi:hypothetical protein
MSRQGLLIGVISIIVLALVSLPFVLADRASGPDAVFAGFLFNPIDGNSYLAKMYEGWRGDWQFTLPYTAQKGQGSYLFLFYLFLGHVARLTGLSLPVTFHLTRLIGTGFMLWSLYHFLDATIGYTGKTGLAFALAALGSGLGWLVFLFGPFTSDFWVAEAYPFLSAFATPHFTLGIALLLFMLSPQTAEYERNKGIWSRGIWVGLAGLGLAVISPFGVAIAMIISGITLAWDGLLVWRHSRQTPHLAERHLKWVGDAGLQSGLRRLLWVVVLGSPLLLYDLWVVKVDPLLAGWNAQNLTPSPPLWDVIISLSPALLLAAPGAWVAFRHNTPGERRLLVWLISGLALLYLPFGLQRRFMMGLFIPVVGLAIVGLQILQEKRRLLPLVVFILSLPTTLLILLAAQHGIQTQDAQLYLTRDEMQAFTWLSANTPPDSLVLAAPETGLFIPAFTGRRVLYGHPFETVNAQAEQAELTRVFQSGGQPAQFLQQHKVNYLFWGPRERQTGDLSTAGLKVVYQNGGVTIFAING